MMSNQENILEVLSQIHNSQSNIFNNNTETQVKITKAENQANYVCLESDSLKVEKMFRLLLIEQ
jgi:hypothetical protein